MSNAFVNVINDIVYLIDFNLHLFQNHLVVYFFAGTSIIQAHTSIVGIVVR